MKIFQNYSKTLQNILKELLLYGSAFVFTFIVAVILLAILGDNPFIIFTILFSSTFGSVSGFGYLLFYATPLIFTGLSVALSMKCGLFNIGAEGQLYTGTFVTALAGLTFTGLPAVLLLPLCILCGMLAGAAWGFIPGYLRARFGAHEVINTIMLNFIAISLISYLTVGPFRAPGDQIPQTIPIAETAEIPSLVPFLQSLGMDIPSSVPLNWTIIIAILTAFGLNFLLKRTKLGYKIRAVGYNREASGIARINIIKTITLTMTISGALAGMVGINEVLGYRHNYLNNFSPGYGFTGIAVALLARNHPVGIIFSAILFGAITRGGLIIDIYSDNISKDFVFLLQGLLILSIISIEIFRKKKLIPGFRLKSDHSETRPEENV